MHPLLASLPDWSVTLDEARVFPVEAVKAAALTLLGDPARLLGQHRIGAAARDELLRETPAFVATRVGELDEGTVFSSDELLAALTAILGPSLVQRVGPRVLELTSVWRAELAEHSARHCLRDLHLQRASALYLFLRVIFALPTDLAIDEARSFGGWIHPHHTAPAPGGTYDLSWPVDARMLPRRLGIQRFVGYLGRGYDALGEYDYFARRFPLRSPEAVRDAEFVVL